ncbi:MAG TPA: dihydrolipoyl dehydrogenase [Spirochaetota bacterium]|nr:dihydrolipoyl dehydrogenase [Spirochaetota bacterium]
MKYDVIIIGAGPGGYHAANLLGEKGKRVLVVEKNKLGGVCLNIGCIPTKALISISDKIRLLKKNEITGVNTDNSFQIDKSAINDKVLEATNLNCKAIEYLFKKNSVECVYGEASFVDKNTIMVNGVNYNAKKIVIATGSRNREYTTFSGGNTLDKVITSTEALFLDNIPKSIIIIGGGAIGVEFAYIFNNLGSDVTILEYFSHLLPNMDSECGKTIERTFKKDGIKVVTDAKLLKIGFDETNFVVYNRKEKEEKIASEFVLVAMGRTPNTDINGIEKLNLNYEKNYIKVDSNFKTNIENIYAIGDVVYGKPLLAHTAYYEAELMVNHILNNTNNKPDYGFVPFCIYSEPQVAGFGITEEQAKEKNLKFKVLKSFFKASGKAIAIGKTDGFVKIIVDGETNTILGASIVGENATEIIHTLLPVARLKLPIKSITETIFAHPTLVELIKDTCSNF